jgi:hypothetical protein
MTARTYSSPASFKQALEQRLRSSARGGTAFARKRQLLVVYLEQLTIADTLRVLPPLFPRHSLICELVVRSFLDKRPTKVQQQLATMGAVFKLVEDPYAVFEQNGYRLVESESTVATSIALSLPRWLSFVSRALPQDIRDGSRVAVFASPSEPRRDS